MEKHEFNYLEPKKIRIPGVKKTAFNGLFFAGNYQKKKRAS